MLIMINKYQNMWVLAMNVWKKLVVIETKLDRLR